MGFTDHGTILASIESVLNLTGQNAMSDQKSDLSQQPASDQPVNTARRKLTGAALAGPVVLGTLATKQALGGDIPYHCTVSGKISNTDSVRPGENVECKDLGRSPGFWKNHWKCWGLDGPATGTTQTVAGIFRPFNVLFTGSSITSRMGDILNNCEGAKNPLVWCCRL